MHFNTLEIQKTIDDFRRFWIYRDFDLSASENLEDFELTVISWFWFIRVRIKRDPPSLFDGHDLRSSAGLFMRCHFGNTWEFPTTNTKHVGIDLLLLCEADSQKVKKSTFVSTYNEKTKEASTAHETKSETKYWNTRKKRHRAKYWRKTAAFFHWSFVAYYTNDWWLRHDTCELHCYCCDGITWCGRHFWSQLSYVPCFLETLGIGSGLRPRLEMWSLNDNWVQKKYNFVWLFFFMDVNQIEKRSLWVEGNMLKKHRCTRTHSDGSIDGVFSNWISLCTFVLWSLSKESESLLEKFGENTEFKNCSTLDFKSTSAENRGRFSSGVGQKL